MRPLITTIEVFRCSYLTGAVWPILLAITQGRILYIGRWHWTNTQEGSSRNGRRAGSALACWHQSWSRI